MTEQYDRHVRRTGKDYVQAILALLPQGQAWPREPQSTLVRTLTGLAEYWGFVDGRAADLLKLKLIHAIPWKCFRIGNAIGVCLIHVSLASRLHCQSVAAF